MEDLNTNTYIKIRKLYIVLIPVYFQRTFAFLRLLIITTMAIREVTEDLQVKKSVKMEKYPILMNLMNILDNGMYCLDL